MSLSLAGWTLPARESPGSRGERPLKSLNDQKLFSLPRLISKRAFQFVSKKHLPFEETQKPKLYVCNAITSAQGGAHLKARGYSSCSLFHSPGRISTQRTCHRQVYENSSGLSRKLYTECNQESFLKSSCWFRRNNDDNNKSILPCFYSCQISNSEFSAETCPVGSSSLHQ